MLRFAANLSTMFTDRPLEERFAAARDCGFDAVELQYPYQLSAERLAALLEQEHLALSLLNAPLGAEPGNRGLACIPGRQDDFKRSVIKALRYASATTCPLVHILVGLMPPEATRGQAQRVALDNLDWAADVSAKGGTGIVIEALNHVDVPGCFIRSLDDAAALVERTGRSRLGLIFDVYHCAMSGRDPVEAFSALAPLVWHVQIADVPGRGSPGTGAVDWRAMFGAIVASRHEAAIGCEYLAPLVSPANLDWMDVYNGACRPGRRQSKPSQT